MRHPRSLGLASLQAATLRFAVAALLSVVLSPALNTAYAATVTDTDGDSVPHAAESLIHADLQNADTDGEGRDDLADRNPVLAENPMPLDGPTAPFRIAEALAENNYDPALKRDATDHLEILVANDCEQPLADFSVRFSIEDLDSGKSESYFRKLDGFEVPATGDARIHFEHGSVAGHFRANPESLYLRSAAAKTFTVLVQRGMTAPVSVEIANDAGGAEEADWPATRRLPDRATDPTPRPVDPQRNLR